MKFKEFKHEPVQPDTYEASMAMNQLHKIGKHAIKLHNMIDDAAEMESWVAKKIDLAGDYVKKVHGYMQGVKAGYYEAHGGEHTTSGRSMTKGEMSKREKIVKGMKKDKAGFKKRYGKDAEAVMYATATKQAMGESRDQIGDYAREIKSGRIVRIVDYTDDDEGIYTISYGEDKGESDVTAKDLKFLDQTGVDQEEIGKFDEDAGEGHMSKSTLYHTAKYAIELMSMINKGDDLEGWVQSKLNKAADYLQGVYNYEEYQKLNPYREELDPKLIQRHAEVVQKNIDEILEKETDLDDIDTKPGMMRILKKRVNEVEKEIAKETRKKTDESGILYRAGVKKYGKDGMRKIQSAAAKGASHQEIGKIKDKHIKDSEDLEEGLKDWAKSLAMAGVFVAGMAGMGSIQNAIDNSVPAVKAMNTALELANDQGNTELANMIEKDLSAVKVRLSSGRDLNFVKSMQDKYSKFMTTEGLAYESQLAVMLNQRLK